MLTWIRMSIDTSVDFELEMKRTKMKVKKKVE